MDYNHNTLQKALLKLPAYEPNEEIWGGIRQKLNEEPLQNALKNLSEYEPDERLWELIENKSVIRKHFYIGWWYAAAILTIVSSIGLWISRENKTQHVSYSEETVDFRLQVNKEQVTDYQYQQLKTYCETETLVCNNKDFKRLTQEYETLRTASEQLMQAMGKYNTKPGLVRQFSIVEQEKADVLNKMAKMI